MLGLDFQIWRRLLWIQEVTAEGSVLATRLLPIHTNGLHQGGGSYGLDLISKHLPDPDAEVQKQVVNTRIYLRCCMMLQLRIAKLQFADA